MSILQQESVKFMDGPSGFCCWLRGLRYLHGYYVRVAGTSHDAGCDSVLGDHL